MNRNRVVLTILFAVVLGLSVSGYVYRQLSRAAAMQHVTVATTQVVAAAAHLPPGARLQEKDLKYIAWPASDPVPGRLTRVEDCVSRTMMTSVEANEPILESKLAPEGAGSGLPATIPEGMRAVSVAVNEVIGVAGFVMPGTTVDVLVTGSPEALGANVKLTRTIMENVRVLAAGQKVEQDKQGAPQNVTVITLLATPEQANQLALASTQGRIQLALRNAADTKKTDPPAVYEAALFGGSPPAVSKQSTHAAPPSPAPTPAAAPYTVEVIRGAKREVDSFPNR
jgi:pilus assembly protein CpaB